MRQFKGVCMVLGVLFAGAVSAQLATNGMWQTDANGLWADPANWTNGAVAGGVGSSAYFTNSTADRTVTIPAGGVAVVEIDEAYRVIAEASDPRVVVLHVTVEGYSFPNK